MATNTAALQEAIKRARAASDTTGADYSASLLASGGIQQAIRQALQAADPSMSQMRDEKTQADTRLGSVFANSMDQLKGVNDPAMREAIRSKLSSEYGAESAGIGGKISDLGASQDKTVGNLGSVFGAITAAKQFDVGQKDKSLQELLDEQKTQEQRDFEARQNDLNRRNAMAIAQLSHSGGGTTIEDAVKNPLLAFLASGGKRVQKADGGFDFFDKSGKPISVEQAAASVPGATKDAFLTGSSNVEDQNAIQAASGKPLSAAAQQLQTNAISGLQSLATIKDLVSKGISQGEVGNAKYGWTSSLFGSDNTKAWRNASTNIGDILARLRTGAQINEEEMKLYKQFVPGASDFKNPAIVQQKLQTIDFILNNLARGTKPTAADIQRIATGAVDTGV